MPSGSFTPTGGLLLSAPVTLTNAQIKTLPTAAVQVVAAPASNVMFVVVSGVVILDARGGAYTNLGSIQMNFGYGTTYSLASMIYVEATQGAFADSSAIHILANFGVSNTSGQSQWFAERAQVAGLALNIGMNAGSGNLTGGNAANSMTVTVAYYAITLP